MKTIKYLTLRLMAVSAIAIAFALPAKAQVTPFTYFNVDWQFNAPISNNFANKASGRRWILCTAGFVKRCLYQLSYQ